MSKYYLHQQIGDPVTMILPQEYATDSLSTEGVEITGNGCPIAGADGVMILLTTGDLTTDSLTVSLTYSSTGAASDASASTTTFLAATDCVYEALDSDGEGKVGIIDINLVDIGLGGDVPGRFFASFENTGGSEVCMIGIPYNLRYTPATNAIDVIIPDAL